MAIVMSMVSVFFYFIDIELCGVEEKEDSGRESLMYL